MGGIPGTSLACANCKKRKIRCDLEKPECWRCIKKGLPCPGYPGRDFIQYTFSQSGYKLSKKKPLEETPTSRTPTRRAPSEYSQPVPDGNSNFMTKGSQLPVQPASITHGPVICPSIEWKLLDVFPPPKKPMRYDWNIYFNHFRLYTSSYAFPFNGPDITIWFFNMAQQSPILIDVLAASGAFTCASLLLLKGKPPQEARRCVQDALQLKFQSVASLKKLLNNPSHFSLEVAISVVANLICIGLMNHDSHSSSCQAKFSGYLQNQGFEATSETLEMHINGIKTMVKLLGGFDNIDHKLKVPIYSCGNAAAFSGNMTLKFPMSPVWEAKIEQQFSKIAAKNVHSTPSHFASGLINNTWFASLDPRLKNLIHSFKWIVLAFEGILHVDSRFNGVKNDYLTLCTYRLLDFNEDPLIIPCEETIRLTITLYSVVRLYILPPQQCERFIITYLQPNIKENSEQIQKISPDLLFWVLWIGVLGSFGLKCHELFVEHLVEVAVSRGIKTWSEASNVLEKFLFVDRGASEPGKAFWASVMMHEKFS